MKTQLILTCLIMANALQALQLSELVKARQEMEKAIGEYQKSHPMERVLFDSQEIKGFSQNSGEKDQRLSVPVRQDRYLKPVKPDQSILENQQLGGMRVLEQKSLAIEER